MQKRYELEVRDLAHRVGGFLFPQLQGGEADPLAAGAATVATGYAVHLDGATTEQDEPVWLQAGRELGPGLEELETLTEAGLNEHIIDKHLALPVSLALVGIQFDAELAQYLGHFLDATALATHELLAAIGAGKFGETRTFNLMRLEPINYLSFLNGKNILGINPQEILATLEREFNYTQRLRAELGTLVRLGVVSDEVALIIQPDIDQTDLLPIATDSFYGQFDIRPRAKQL